jgi:hypothetical protein
MIRKTKDHVSAASDCGAEKQAEGKDFSHPNWQERRCDPRLSIPVYIVYKFTEPLPGLKNLDVGGAAREASITAETNLDISEDFTEVAAAAAAHTTSGYVSQNLQTADANIPTTADLPSVDPEVSDAHDATSHKSSPELQTAQFVYTQSNSQLFCSHFNRPHLQDVSPLLLGLVSPTTLAPKVPFVAMQPAVKMFVNIRGPDPGGGVSLASFPGLDEANAAFFSAEECYKTEMKKYCTDEALTAPQQATT